MEAIDDALVCVHHGWNGWRSAEVRVGDLQAIHWRQPEGAPRPLVHGYVSCSTAAGRIGHDCEPATGPHLLLVCILKRSSLPTVYAEISRRADAGQGWPMPETVGPLPAAR